MKVILEGQGDKKTIPILSSGKPVFSTARRRARIAAASMGGSSGSRCGINPGKRTRISRSMVGHAVLISG